MRRKILLLCLACLLASALPAPAAEDSCGPEPRMGPALHRVLFAAYKLLDKKKTAQAAGLLAKFVRENPGRKHYRLSFLRGVLDYQGKKLKAAEVHFKQAAELRPCHGPSLQNLAAVRYELGRPLEAAQTALAAYRVIKPPQPGVLYQAAVFYLLAGRTRQALPLLQKLAVRPKPKESWLTALVRAHMELKQPKKARPVVQRLLRMRPGAAKYWRLLASLELTIGDYPAAAAALDVAYRLKPPEPSGWRNLAGLFRAAGTPLKAVQYYRRSWGGKPSAKDHDRLAAVYLQGHYLDRALEQARRAAEMKPSARRWGLVGRILLRQKKYAAAYQALCRAAGISDKRGRYSLLAGYAAMQMERLDQARRAFGLCLKHAAPKSGTAREAARALEAVRAYEEQIRRRGVPDQAAMKKP